LILMDNITLPMARSRGTIMVFGPKGKSGCAENAGSEEPRFPHGERMAPSHDRMTLLGGTRYRFSPRNC
jgi:hypothetical protein